MASPDSIAHRDPTAAAVPGAGRAPGDTGADADAEALPRGLDDAEVADRTERGLTNRAPADTSRPLSAIVRANVFTRFNAILGALLVVILTIGPIQDALFGVVLVLNTAIGIVQEWRAKRTLDQLSLLNTPAATVVRGGERRDVAVDEVVLGDVIELSPGAQVIADGEVVAADALEVDESLLTGESVPEAKGMGDQVLSGSFVTAGRGWYRADKVGAEAYANSLATEARRFSLVRSELRQGTDTILRGITFLLVPTAALLVYSQLDSHETLIEAIRGSVAGVVAMIPEGLVLLTSIAFAASVVRLGRRKVLVQELAAIEVLARVDVVCIDKTGTITEPVLEVVEVVPLGGDGAVPGVPGPTGSAAGGERPGSPAPPGQAGPAAQREVEQALGALAWADPEPNASMAALATRFPSPGWTPTWRAAFSSARRFSGTGFGPRGDWLLGAPDGLLDAARQGGTGRDGADPDVEALPAGGSGVDAPSGDPADGSVADAPSGDARSDARNGDASRSSGAGGTAGEMAELVEWAAAIVDEQSRKGRRVLLLARVDGDPGDTAPANTPVAVVALEERLRSDAADTLEFFRQQGVALKVISGDDPRTVGAVAGRVGIAGADAPADARQLPDDEDALADTLESTSVFGRVAPHQKQSMVRALQSRGHVVAMTGDGVNDVLALKEADLGVAMGSGSAASRAVAPVVLMDSAFASLPPVLAEGRQVIANIERVANLFITKTVYASLLALTVGVAGLPFPFLPRHLTIISSLTIGIPAFFLALAPNNRRYLPGFVQRVLRFAIPAGAVAATATLSAYALARDTAGIDRAEARTVATIALFMVALWVLAILARPASLWRTGLVATMAAAFVVVLWVPALQDYFALDLPSRSMLLEAVGVAALAGVALELGWQASGWVRQRFGPGANPDGTRRLAGAGAGAGVEIEHDDEGAGATAAAGDRVADGEGTVGRSGDRPAGRPAGDDSDRAGTGGS